MTFADYSHVFSQHTGHSEARKRFNLAAIKAQTSPNYFGQPIADITVHTRIKWSDNANIEMLRFMSRVRFSVATKDSAIGPLLKTLRMHRDENPAATSDIIKIVSAKLFKRLNQTMLKKVDPTWPEYTSSWASETWDGNCNPPAGYSSRYPNLSDTASDASARQSSPFYLEDSDDGADLQHTLGSHNTGRSVATASAQSTGTLEVVDTQATKAADIAKELQNIALAPTGLQLGNAGVLAIPYDGPGQQRMRPKPVLNTASTGTGSRSFDEQTGSRLPVPTHSSVAIDTKQPQNLTTGPLESYPIIGQITKVDNNPFRNPLSVNVPATAKSGATVSQAGSSSIAPWLPLSTLPGAQFGPSAMAGAVPGTSSAARPAAVVESLPDDLAKLRDAAFAVHYDAWLAELTLDPAKRKLDAAVALCPAKDSTEYLAARETYKAVLAMYDWKHKASVAAKEDVENSFRARGWGSALDAQNDPAF